MREPVTVRVTPATTVIHLDFNADEDVDLLLEVLDSRQPPQRVPLSSAVGTIALPDGPVLHRWNSTNGNLVLVPDQLEPDLFTRVRLLTTRAETDAWYEAWTNAEWQLDVVDIFGKQKRPCEGQVRVRARRGPREAVL